VNDLICYFVVFFVIKELPIEMSLVLRKKHFTHDKRMEIACKLARRYQPD